MKANRFLFDHDFAAPAAPAAPVEPVEPEIPTITVPEHEALMAKAEKKAFERGRQEGRKEAADTTESRLGVEVSNLARQVGELIGEIDRMKGEQEKDAIALSFLVARRLAAHLIAREPLGEVIALVSECLGPLREAPHLVIRVRDGDVEDLKTRVDPIVHEKGFEGRLVILGDPEIERGDCRIEWADGGIVRDRKTVERQIDQAAKRYFAARTNAAGDSAGQSEF
ncbi:flagellar assembly protein FliH [Stappia sp. GBMRC 2046]|uniref:Flagellar assembly protein FliH n=2 Tax=Stappia sediminis TaxID=2692190 RepID=A0A7X3LQL7_9HYPH|nr:flagellar assembly protein FliH [Stappia sediminis]